MNMENPVGSLWLQHHFKLQQHILTHKSYAGTQSVIEIAADGSITETFRARYAVKEDTVFNHLVFSFKYDDLHLDFLKAVFENIPQEDITAFIRASPSGRYERKTGYLYEWLTGIDVALPEATGNYIDLMDPEKYITGKTKKITRWHLNDNLLGNRDFCPIVRNTKALQTALQVNFSQLVEDLARRYPADLFRRAGNYLYTKETRSSYEIEREKPSQERERRFIGLLEKAGQQSSEAVLSEANLVLLQNSIVDTRFAATAFRNFQNYVGETLPGLIERIHYICPPPELVQSLVQGLQLTAAKTEGTHAVIRAAITAFGFVFIHPFEDGNGRLHRFLIHDTLSRERIVPAGLIIPVSAHMLNNMRDYDAALEAYSAPLMQRIRYQKTADQELEVTNSEAVAAYFRYPDLTKQCIYLATTIAATITGDMAAELDFLLYYDELKKDMQAIVDMPDKDINRFILLTHQNKGAFPKRRRNDFPKLTDEEIDALQAAYINVFG
ncbi:Fic family protein [soil metagenome]